MYITLSNCETVNFIMNKRKKHQAFKLDFAGAGKLQDLRSRRGSIVIHGRNIDYYLKVSKNWLTVKEQYFDDAIKIFKGAGIKITLKAWQQLRTIVKSREYKTQYFSEAAQNWIQEIER